MTTFGGSGVFNESKTKIKAACNRIINIHKRILGIAKGVHLYLMIVSQQNGCFENYVGLNQKPVLIEYTLVYSGP